MAGLTAGTGLSSRRRTAPGPCRRAHEPRTAPAALPCNPCNRSCTSCSGGTAAPRHRRRRPRESEQPGTATLAGGPSFFPPTLPCIDSLSQRRCSARPLDPTRRAWLWAAATLLARKRLRDEGSGAAKSSGTWLRALLSTATQQEDKVTLSKGATGPANTGVPVHRPPGRDVPSCPQRVPP